MKGIFNKSRSISSVLILVLMLVVVFVTNIVSEEYAAKRSLIAQESHNDIIPKPVSYQRGKGNFNIKSDTPIYIKGNTEEETEEINIVAEFLKEKINALSGFELNIIKNDNPPDNSIYLTTVNSKKEQGDEGYNIIATNNRIEIIAYKPEGVSRAVQTLRQMIPSNINKDNLNKEEGITVVAATINDKPEYSYRGLMLDVARHFFSVEEVKRQIDLAAQYKINKVHLHLSDDQGWRLEIKQYPDLTLIGGSTEVGGGPGGYYTQEEFKEIVRFAQERYIEIIPEFDMPGHTNAALASYGFLNPDGKRKPLYTGTEVGFSSLMTDNEKTYEFIDNVFKEVSEISPSKYLHIGGDEALNTKKEDYDYFVGRVSKIAEKYGKMPIGWDPIDTSPEINSNVILQNWKDSNEAAQKKEMKMIISIAQKAYLDMKYNKDTPYGSDWAGYIPIETAYKWDPTNFSPKNLILGIEAPLWTENISTVDEMDYMIYPRLLGYAELGWTPKNNRVWEEYKIRLRNQGQRMENENINYYKDNSIWDN